MYLRDYLKPNGLFEYNLLPVHMQDFVDRGIEVHLVSVPGFLMVSGYPARNNSKAYFFSKNRSHKTAKIAFDALY